ncbi:hypothetical protein L579_2887 [Pantoea sp. AS-PWVM4]|nr:hypothetical protein L579_2887 [Pantoea sp. AS-PWVM4]
MTVSPLFQAQHATHQHTCLNTLCDIRRLSQRRSFAGRKA